MDISNEMKGLLKDLGLSLHRALTKDDDIKNITDQIKANGFDIYLFMEANIALDKREDESEGRLFFHAPETQKEVENMNFSSYDAEFLSSLKIQTDEN